MIECMIGMNNKTFFKIKTTILEMVSCERLSQFLECWT